jgi:hypothetical protein
VPGLGPVALGSPPMVIMGISKISKSMGDIFILHKKEINITHTQIYIYIYGWWFQSL